MNYYVTIDGKKLDKRLLMLAENAVEGQGDGRISNADAQRIIDAVKDGNIYTEVEKDTVEYIRDNFKWTESADSWFRGEIASWSQKK